MFVLSANQTYRDLKDRQQLLGYRGKVERGSAEERKIDELLNIPVRKTQSPSSSSLVTSLNWFSFFSKSAGRTEHLLSTQRKG